MKIFLYLDTGISSVWFKAIWNVQVQFYCIDLDLKIGRKSTFKSPFSKLRGFQAEIATIQFFFWKFFKTDQKRTFCLRNQKKKTQQSYHSLEKSGYMERYFFKLKKKKIFFG